MNYNANENSFGSLNNGGPVAESTPAQNNEDATSSDAFELGKIRVHDDGRFPLDLDIEAEVYNILAAGVFKGLENQNLYNKICDMMLNQRYHNLVEALFWVIYMVEFQKEDVEILEHLRKHLGKLYSEYFSSLQSPKEELSNMGIFGGAYLCHIMFFNLFPKERERFDMRFILNCYHIVIHKVNGIFVSDFYIQNSIERIFGNKFFHYEKRTEKKKKVEVKDFRNEPLLRDLNYDLKNLPQVAGGLELAHELSSKFRKMPKKYKTGTLSEMNESNNRSSSIGHKQIMRLTQQEEKSVLMNTSESAPYFPKLKFNCHQISPTVSSFLENSNNTLPFQKRKVIHYSNNKHVGDGVQVGYQSQLDATLDPKLDKKDKKKNQLKGTIADYKLKNRTEDYYLGYMQRDMKSKYRYELDMKYILDNIRPGLRSDNKAKPFNEDYSKKYATLPLNYTNNNNADVEEEDHDSIRNKKSLTRNFSLEREEVVIGEQHDGVVGDSSDHSPDKLQKVQDESLGSSLPLIKIKTKGVMKDDYPSPLRSTKKQQAFVKFEENGDRFVDESSVVTKDSDLKKTTMPEILKFHAAANKKLGKGKFFVSLSDNEEEQELDAQKDSAKKYAYKDQRKRYYGEHDKLIRKDIEANIDNIVHRLMMKQNVFNRNFGRFAKK